MFGAAPLLSILRRTASLTPCPSSSTRETRPAADRQSSLPVSAGPPSVAGLKRREDSVEPGVGLLRLALLCGTASDLFSAREAARSMRQCRGIPHASHNGRA